MSNGQKKRSFNENQRNYGDELLACMEVFRNEGQLCDVVITTEDKQFFAHKLVLAASSSFFQSLFTLDMSERNKGEVELNNIEPAVMAQVLDYMYTGRIPAILEPHDARELYMAADYLILPGLKDMTTRNLAKSLSPENCLRTMLWAHRLASRVLFAQAFRFVLDHFRAVSRTEDFLKLPSQEVRIFLSSDNLRILDEEDVYKALKTWTEYSPEKRQSFYVNYFSLVRLEHLSRFFLKEVVLPDVLRLGDDRLRNDFSETLTSFSDLENSSVSHIINPLQPPRRQVAMVIAVLAPDVYSYIPTTGEWFEMASVPTLRIFSSSALCQGVIYNVGGLLDGDDSTNIVECFDPTANTWSTKASLPVPTRAAGLAVLGSYLYVVGGKSNSARFNIVQRYDPSTDNWNLVTSLQEPRSGTAAVGCHGKVYAIGGRKDETTFLNSVERYCPITNTWSCVQPMNVARASAAAACIRDNIYVIGGVRATGTSRNACEVYRVGNDQWDMIADTVVARSYAGICSFCECLLVFGGEDNDHFHDTIEFYTIEQDKWQIVDKMPKDEKFVDCCTTFISKDLLPIFSRVK